MFWYYAQTGCLPCLCPKFILLNLSMVGWILDGTACFLFIDCIGFISAFLSRSQQSAFLSLLLLLLSCPCNCNLCGLHQLSVTKFAPKACLFISVQRPSTQLGPLCTLSKAHLMTLSRDRHFARFDNCTFQVQESSIFYN